MKAALQNLVLYLLCLASVVLAAPTQLTLLPEPFRKGSKPVKSQTNREHPFYTQQKGAAHKNFFILEGVTRFELW